MYLPARLCLLSLLVGLANSQRSRPKTSQSQGRTLGLFSPLLFGTRGGLFDVPVVPVSGGSAAAGGGVQSDPYYGGAGGVGGGGYNNYYGYRPSYGYGYSGLGLGYPGLAQSYYGYPGYGYYRPSYSYNNYGGYQRPVQYPNYNYGSRPNYNNFGSYNNYGSRPGYNNYAGAAAPITPSPSAGISPGIGGGAGVGGAGAGGAGAGPGSQLSTEQAAQLAGLLGQALGSSLRPLVSVGGAATNSATPALSGILGLLG